MHPLTHLHAGYFTIATSKRRGHGAGLDVGPRIEDKWFLSQAASRTSSCHGTFRSFYKTL